MSEKSFFLQAPDLENKEKKYTKQSVQFCNNCGTENTLDSKYCKKCGSGLCINTSYGSYNQNNMNNFENNDVLLHSSEKKVKATKDFVQMIIVIAVILAAFIITIYLGITAKKTINMNDYLTYSFDGFEGYGKVITHVEWDKIEEDYGDIIKYKSMPRDEWGFYYDASSPIEYIEYCVSMDIESNGNLSNGDQVEIKWDIDSYLNQYVDCNLKARTQKVTVTGLDSFVQSSNQIDEDTMVMLDNQAKMIFKEKNSHDEGEEILDMQSIGYYFFSAMDYDYLLSQENWGFKPPYNRLYLIYKAKMHNFHQNKWGDYDNIFDIYWYISFDDLSKETDGKINIDLDKYTIPGFWIHKSALVYGSGVDGKSWDYSGFENFDKLYYEVVPTMEKKYYLEEKINSEVLLSN